MSVCQSQVYSQLQKVYQRQIIVTIIIITCIFIAYLQEYSCISSSVCIHNVHLGMKCVISPSLLIFEFEDSRLVDIVCHWKHRSRETYEK